MSEYWLGVLTTPAIAAASIGLAVGWGLVIKALGSRGITFSARWHRGVDKIEEYTLRRDIWWERPFGPVFVGGWYREKPAYQAPSHARFGRWVGIGRPDGPCFIVFHTRDLGEAHA